MRDNIQSAITECILESLCEAFSDNIFQTSIRRIPAEWRMDNFTNSLPSTSDRIEVVVDYESQILKYQMAVMDDIIMICGQATDSDSSHCLAKKRFDINEPDFGDTGMKIKHVIINDVVAGFHQARQMSQMSLDTPGSPIFIHESFTITKSQSNLSKGRLGFALHQLIIPEQLSLAAEQLYISEYNPIVISAVYRAEVIVDGGHGEALGVFALFLDSKMIQTSIISFGIIEN